jgi:hypothetical protein
LPITKGRAVSRGLSTRDLILYVAIGILVSAAAIAWPIVVPQRFWLGHAWFSLVFFTVLLAAILTQMYWRARRRAQIFGLLGLFLAVHLAAYAVLLHYVPDWPAFWYVPSCTAEVMLFIALAKLWLHVLPSTTKL